jgi:2,7-dihydroxy-5-methyl-1-naphthoate 7-O-methyltransferase
LSIGLLRRVGNDVSLTDLGEALRSAYPGSPASSLDINGIVGRISLAQLRLLDSIRTGQAAYPAVYGKGFWEDLATDHDLSARFDDHMGSGDPSAAVAAHDWTTAGWVVDVGGGNGNLLAGILHANPEVRGTVVELAGPAEAARRKFAMLGYRRGHRS